MKKIFGLINFAALAIFVYEIYFLFTNGTAGNVNHIVIVMMIGIMFLVKFLVKSAAKIIRFWFIAAILYAIASNLIPFII